MGLSFNRFVNDLVKTDLPSETGDSFTDDGVEIEDGVGLLSVTETTIDGLRIVNFGSGESSKETGSDIRIFFTDIVVVRQNPDFFFGGLPLRLFGFGDVGLSVDNSSVGNLNTFFSIFFKKWALFVLVLGGDKGSTTLPRQKFFLKKKLLYV